LHHFTKGSWTLCVVAPIRDVAYFSKWFSSVRSANRFIERSHSWQDASRFEEEVEACQIQGFDG
jgi:hypothetical protein